jgi:MYND finger
MCGKCREVYYCKYEHQKADWGRHNKHCKSIDEKRLEHFQDKRMRKSEIFEQLAKTEVPKALNITGKLVEEEKSFIQKVGDCNVETEIELGSSICMNIRLLIVAKEFSMAQDVLH